MLFYHATLSLPLLAVGARAEQNHIYLIAQSAIATTNSGIPTQLPMQFDYRFTATMTYTPQASATTFFIGDSWNPQAYTAVSSLQLFLGMVWLVWCLLVLRGISYGITGVDSDFLR
jgi:hypothetical protein